MKFAEVATSSLPDGLRQNTCTLASGCRCMGCVVAQLSALVNVSCKCEALVTTSGIHSMWLTIATTSHSLEAYIPSSTLSNNGCLHIA